MLVKPDQARGTVRCLGQGKTKERKETAYINTQGTPCKNSWSGNVRGQEKSTRLLTE